MDKDERRKADDRHAAQPQGSDSNDDSTYNLMEGNATKCVQYASGNVPTKPKSTTSGIESPQALGQLPSASMTKKSTLEWQANSSALGQPSAPMAEKSTLEWQANKPTIEWQATTPSLGHPSALMNCKPTTEWQTKTPTLVPQSPQIVPIPTPTWTLLSSSNKIWPSYLIEIIRVIKTIPPRRSTPPNFTFELTNEAAERNNTLLMHKYKGSLVALLESQQDLTVGYGLEFCDK